MATDIGVKISLSGEAEYQKKIKEIIAEQKALSAELKATDTALDKNASAQDKATKKAEILNKQIENQKKYVAELAKKLEEAENAQEKDNVAISNAREKLAKAETALNKMEAQLKDVNSEIGKTKWDTMKTKLDEVGKKLKDVGGKMKDFGTDMSKYVSAPIAAVAGLSVKAFTEVDDAMDELVKMTGKTGDELKGLEDIAKTLSTTLPVSLEDSAKAVGEVNTRFDLSGNKAQELSEQYLKFAKITGTDVVSAIDSTQHALATWGLSAENAGDLMDVLAKVSQDTGASVDDLAAGIADNKLIFEEMGMSVYTAAGFLGELDKNGVDSSATMAGLKKALQNATKQGKPLDEALKELSDTLASGDTDTEAYAEAMELFGNKAGPQLADAIRDGRISLEDFARVAADSMGSVDQTFEATLDPADKFTTTMNELKILGADVGGTLLEALAPAIETVAGWIKDVAEWWGNLSPEMQNAILIIGGIAAAIGPLIGLIGSLATVMGALNIAMGPVLLIILAVAAAIAGIVLVITHWGEITEWLGKVWEKVTGWIKGAAEDVGNWVSDKWNKVTEWTSTAWNNVKEWTSEAWDNVKETVKGAAEAVGSWVSEKWENVKSWTSEAWETVKSKTSDAWETVKSTVRDAAENVRQKIHDKWESIKSNTKEAWENVKQKVDENGGGIKGIIGTVTEEMKNNWSDALNWINEKTGGKLGDVWQTVTDKLGEIKQKFVDKWEEIKQTVSDAIEKIKGFFQFDWSLPKIKLPHFTITGKFSLNPPQIPHFSVSWYKSAYSNPIMFTSPTILGTASGLKGFGDGNGAEIVIGQNMMQRMIAQAVKAGGGGSSNYTIDITVNGAVGQDVEDLAEAVAEQLTFEIQRREAALA